MHDITQEQKTDCFKQPVYHICTSRQACWRILTTLEETLHALWKCEQMELGYVLSLARNEYRYGICNIILSLKRHWVDVSKPIIQTGFIDFEITGAWRIEASISYPRLALFGRCLGMVEPLKIQLNMKFRLGSLFRGSKMRKKKCFEPASHGG